MAFTRRLGLVVQSTNVGTEKINSAILETYKIVIAALSVIDQVNKVRFFEKNFLMANVSLDVILEMFFLTSSSANVNFLKKKFP